MGGGFFMVRLDAGLLRGSIFQLFREYEMID